MQETKLRWNVINYISAICDFLAESNLEPDRTTLYQGTILDLEEYFGTNEVQTWIMCFALYQHFNYGAFTNFREFAEFLGTKVLNVACMNTDFVALRKRGFIDYSECSSTFQVNDQLTKLVMQNVRIPAQFSQLQNYTDFVGHVGNLFDNRIFDDKTCENLVDELKEYEDKNKSLPLVIRTCNVLVDPQTRFFFYEVSREFLQGNCIKLGFVLNNLYNDAEAFEIARHFMDGDHILIKNGFVEFSEKGNLVNSMIELSEDGKKLLLGDDYCLFEKTSDDKQLIKPEAIKTKKLFYSEANQKQIDDLKAALSQTRFKQIQKRLSANGLPTGVAVLLHGAAGCGKTETVFQLAKKTGRAIVRVDISETKSKWVGDSEKQIKAIFTKYKNLCEEALKSNGRIPILLFNECDAVLSRRVDVAGAANPTLAQMENAFQNIILEEMENLTGILIATTNLTDNLDPAFERRFLFKIRFDYPDVKAKSAIWKSKLKWLSNDNATKLASAYNLSGGEIDNVVRRAVMQEITSGSRPDYKALVELCGNEKLNDSGKTTRTMGFTM